MEKICPVCHLKYDLDRSLCPHCETGTLETYQKNEAHQEHSLEDTLDVEDVKSSQTPSNRSRDERSALSTIESSSETSHLLSTMAESLSDDTQDPLNISPQQPAAPLSKIIGKTLGQAVIQKKIGQGGMGSVYLAHHKVLDIPIAIKILDPYFAQRHPQAVKRFLKEAKAIAKLRHPHIVGVLNAGFEQGYHFISMEFVKGQTMAELLQTPFPLPLGNLLILVGQVSSALEYVHQNQMIHRDIKPSNILIDSKGNAKVSDLGIAKDLNEDQEITKTDQVMGTPYYISPEQATNSKEADSRSDIYSLGCTFYRLFCGEVPFKGKSSFETVHKHLSESVPDPKKENPNLPDPLAQMIQKMIAKDPNDRFQSLTEVIEIINEVLNDCPNISIPSSPSNNFSQSKVDTHKDTDNIWSKKTGLLHEVKTQKKYMIWILIIMSVLCIWIVVSLISDSSKLGISSEITRVNLKQLNSFQLYNLAKNSLEKSDYLQAKKCLELVFKREPNLVEAHQIYSRILKQQEGIEGAIVRYQKWLVKQDLPMIRLTYISLLNTTRRMEEIKLFKQKHPNFAPYYYFASQEWDRQSIKQSFAQIREERELLKTFQRLDKQGEFYKYYINKVRVKNIRETVQKRLKHIQSEKYLDQPIQLWSVNNPSLSTSDLHISHPERALFFFRIFDHITSKSLSYRINPQDPFMTIDLEHLYYPQVLIENIQSNNITIELTYIDGYDQKNGPYYIEVDILKKTIESIKSLLNINQNNWLHYRLDDGRHLLYFTHLMSYRSVLKSIHYSFSEPTLDQSWPLASNKFYSIISEDEKTIYIQITFIDDTKSKVHKFKLH